MATGVAEKWFMVEFVSCKEGFEWFGCVEQLYVFFVAFINFRAHGE